MSVIAAVNALPTENLTIKALNALDFVVPGEWKNVTDFQALVAEVCGPDAPPALLKRVAHRAQAIERLDGERYARALKIYTAVDTIDKVAAGAAVAGKVTDLFGGLGFLKKFTPKPETTQSIDAGFKLIAELLAFGQLNGMPTTDADGLARFAGALADYGRYDLMRIAAWVVFEGMLPLGPNFVQTVSSTWSGMASDALNGNPVFQQLAARLPGDSVAEKQGFVIKTLDTTGEWVNRFIAEKGITQEGVMSRLDGVLSVAEGGMDYVAAALDASTNYFEHTGTQTVGRALARRAYDDLRGQVWTDYVSALPTD